MSSFPFMNNNTTNNITNNNHSRSSATKKQTSSSSASASSVSSAATMIKTGAPAEATAGPPSAFAQFNAWTKEKESFDKLSQQIDLDCARLDTQLLQMRQQQQNLIQRIHTQSDNVGAMHQLQSALEQELVQLQDRLQQERAALTQCAQEAAQQVAADRENKLDFCNRTRGLNLALAAALAQQEDMRLKRMITADTVPVLLEHLHLKPAVEDTLPVSSSHNYIKEPNPENSDSTTESQKCASEELYTAIAELQKATDQLTATRQTVQICQEKIHIHRQAALEQPVPKGKTPWTESQLLEMEHAWSQDFDVNPRTRVVLDSEDENTIILPTPKTSRHGKSNHQGSHDHANCQNADLFYGSVHQSNDDLSQDCTDDEESVATMPPPLSVAVSRRTPAAH